MKKPKIALHWCSSCGGCDESIVDLAEDLLVIHERAEIVFWPAAMDYKFEDVEALKDDEILVSLINGAVRTEEDVRAAALFRRKSRFVVALGSCAYLGGVIGLANLHDRKALLRRAFEEVPSLVPGETGRFTGEKGVPALRKTLDRLDRVVEVDYYIPGCPPPAALVREALSTLLKEERPPRGSVLCEDRALCDTCPLKATKPDRLRVETFKRLHETIWERDRCFLDQGLVCLGPATRGGCGAICIQANMPCKGCFGPAGKASDQGARTLSFLSSLIEEREEEAIRAKADSIPDPGGTAFRYCLPTCALKTKRE